MSSTEREQRLKELLEGDDWKQLVVPALRARVAEQEQRTMRATTLDEVRVCQGAWRALEFLLRDPSGFLSEAKEQ